MLLELFIFTPTYFSSSCLSSFASAEAEQDNDESVFFDHGITFVLYIK